MRAVFVGVLVVVGALMSLGWLSWEDDAPTHDGPRVRMTPGITLEGVLVDAAGHRLDNVVVAAEYVHDTQLRRGTRTDAEGRWRLEALTPGEAVLVALAFDHDAKAKREMTLRDDDRDVRLVAEPIRLSRPPVAWEVAGLMLVDVDDEIREAYELPDHVHVMILDPGSDFERLGIGRLETGYGLWEVDHAPVESVREAVVALIQEASGDRPPPRSAGLGVHAVLAFSDEQMSGTSIQYLRLTPKDKRALHALLGRLPR